MKRITSLLLTFALVICSSLPALAEEQAGVKVDLKKAIEIAKEKLDISSDGMDFQSSYSEGMDGKKLWYLSWQSKERRDKNMSASVNADTGDIVYYNSYSQTMVDSTRIPKYSKEQALEKASEFASRLQPEKFKQTRLQENNSYGAGIMPYYSSDYTFEFVRYINEIPFLDNKITVSVDKNTLMVRSYSFIWDELTFTSIDKAMDIKNAKEIFKDKLGLEASYYITDYGYEQSPKVIVIYSFKNGNKPLDALTGEVVDYYGYSYPSYEKSMRMGDAGDITKGESLSPEEQNSIEESSKYISREAAITALKKYLEVDEKFKLTSVSLSKNYPAGSNPLWNFYWNYTDEEKNEYAYMGGSVDAVTGEVIGFHQGGKDLEPSKDAEPTVTKEAAKLTAESFLKEIQPERFSSSEYRDFEQYLGRITVEKPSAYSFRYLRKSGDIMLPFNSLNVTVNAFTGKITSYNMDWYDIALPEAKNLISLEEAYKILFEKYNFSLKYIKPGQYYDSPTKTDESKLVFVTDTMAGLIDAKTGKLLDYSGNPIKTGDQKVDFSDIKGHWAEGDITTLSELGVIDQENGDFLPDQKIKQKDFVSMLMKSLAPEYKVMSESKDEYDKYYDLAIQRRIIFPDEKSPESAITRLDAAKLIVRALNTAYIADLREIYISKYKDVNQSHKGIGYVSIVSGLDIMTGNNMYFRPDRELSRAEAATAVLRSMKVDTANKK